jgi:hypothetical protein
MTELRQREPRQEDRAFLAFVRLRPCCACGAAPPVQAAHVRMACPEQGKRQTGKGERPSDRWAVPLCQACHQDGPGAQHKGAEAAFWRRAGINPFAIAAALYEEFTSANSSGRQKMLSQVKRVTDFRPKVKAPRRRRPVPNFILPTDKSRPKRKWPFRPLRGTNRWPPKGARKVRPR